jgi:hypothetical protein
MVYTIGYGTRNTPGVSTAQRNTAKEALELAEALESPAAMRSSLPTAIFFRLAALSKLKSDERRASGGAGKK